MRDLLTYFQQNPLQLAYLYWLLQVTADKMPPPSVVQGNGAWLYAWFHDVLQVVCGNLRRLGQPAAPPK